MSWSWRARSDLPKDRLDEIASSAAAQPKEQADGELQNEQEVEVEGKKL